METVTFTLKTFHAIRRREFDVNTKKILSAEEETMRECRKRFQAKVLAQKEIDQQITERLTLTGIQKAMRTVSAARRSGLL